MIPLAQHFAINPVASFLGLTLSALLNVGILALVTCWFFGKLPTKHRWLASAMVTILLAIISMWMFNKMAPNEPTWIMVLNGAVYVVIGTPIVFGLATWRARFIKRNWEGMPS